MKAFGVDATVFDAVHVEPTDASMQAAIEWARSGAPWDALVAVGGGSSIDTAKAVNLLLTNPGELMDYVNKPVGGGQPPSKRCCRSWPSRQRRAPAPRARPSACWTSSRSG